MAKSKSPAAKSNHRQNTATAKKLPPAKRKVEDKVKELEKRLNQLEASLAEEKDETITVNYEVKFFGGAGEIQFKGENLQRTEDGNTSFAVNQTRGKQRVQAGGTAPTGTDGRIEVEVKQGTDILSPFSNNVFKKGLFLSQLLYTIK